MLRLARLVSAKPGVIGCGFRPKVGAEFAMSPIARRGVSRQRGITEADGHGTAKDVWCSFAIYGVWRDVRKRRNLMAVRSRALFLGAALLVCMLTTSQVILAASSVAYVWGAQANAAAPGQYVVRGLAVDQATGSVYVAQAAVQQGAQGTYGTIAKFDHQGNLLWVRGPDLKDVSDIVRVTIPESSPAGIAVDPKTANLYVLVQEADNTTTIHVLNADGRWLRSFPAGLPPTSIAPGPAYGGAFSDDGQKYLISGMLEKLPGPAGDSALLGEDPRGSLYGGRLFVRDDSGTPSDFADDTWVSAGDLADNGEFWDGMMDPRATCFDRLGRPYVGESREHNANNWWGNPYVRSYSSSAPYSLDRCLITGGAQWGIDTDNQNNLWAAWSRDRSAGTPRLVRCVSPEGIRLIGFKPTDNGGSIADPHYCAYDRVRECIVVAGCEAVGSAATQVVVECYTPTLEMPPTKTFTGRVVDKSSGEPIAGANVGYRSAAATDYPANGVMYGFGYWERGRADAQGNYSFTMVDTTSVVDNPGFPIVPIASATGHLSKRTYSYLIGDNPEIPDQRLVIPDIALESADAESITLRLWGKEGSFDPAEEESGLFWVYRSSGSLQSKSAGGDAVAYLGGLYSGGSGWYSRYLNLQIDDRWMYAGAPFDKVWVSVEYFGFSLLTPGSGEFGTMDTIALQADVQGNSDDDRHASVGEAWKTINLEDPQWITVTFPISKAYFANRGLKGSDLRVDSVKPPGSEYVDGWSPEWIRRVTVSRVPPSEGYPLVSGIAQAKMGQAGPLVLEGQTLTSQWNGNTFYLQSQDRSSGIRVRLADGWTSPSLPNSINRLAHVQGMLQNDPSTGEFEIIAQSFGTDATAPAVALNMNSTAAWSLENGVDPTGLKVGVWGKVTNVSQPDSFAVNDGGKDIKVIVDPSLAISWPQTGDYLYVVGIATLEGQSPSNAIRVVRPWDVSNVVDKLNP